MHAAAGIFGPPSPEHQPPIDTPKFDLVRRLSRKICFRQQAPAKECLPNIGPRKETKPLVIAEIRARARDLVTAHHDRDHRSTICSPPGELDTTNLAIIRDIPPVRYTAHHREAKLRYRRWAYFLSYRRHMWTAIPGTASDSAKIRNTPQFSAPTSRLGVRRTTGADESHRLPDIVSKVSAL